MKNLPRILFLITNLFCFFLQSQNLVKNPSFEISNRCPKELGTLSEDAVSWRKPTSGTTDYFTTCSEELSPENNFIGSQKPYDGESFAGFYLYAPNDYREYITAELTTPLERGMSYEISFMVNLAENVEFAINEFDVLLTKKLFTMDTSKNLDLYYVRSGMSTNYKRIIESKFISDSDTWTKISATIKAKGGERFLTLGNFRTNSGTKKEVVRKATRKSAYYFIDMVSVKAVDSYKLEELYVIDNLNFDFNETVVEINYNEQLKKLVSHLKSNPKLKVYLYGHTDAKGSLKYNEDLSQKRAETVAKFLIKSGLSENRISWKGFGFRKPIVTDEKEDLQFKNRRVEFLLTEQNSSYAKTVFEKL
ncbi:OmpA family protein [Cellulophaga sp. HaHaR_3_176]|uniref:OmpA family protein n=1 Tax=Cellulophaga sp. HaHaR_3_176 TaxID=1942464 RepID=UPI001C1F88C6|nr:OmpA family protein [Cellulophaga sp. HaHaR_3_176]QWX82885.1 OmpA family protein [Cellulophaga sp. HaHaR_3_176]